MSHQFTELTQKSSHSLPLNSSSEQAMKSPVTVLDTIFFQACLLLQKATAVFFQPPYVLASFIHPRTSNMYLQVLNDIRVCRQTPRIAPP